MSRQGMPADSVETGEVGRHATAIPITHTRLTRRLCHKDVSAKPYPSFGILPVTAAARRFGFCGHFCDKEAAYLP